MVISFDVLRVRFLAAVVLIAVMSTLPTPGHAAEQRCGALGASCLCSEPLQATAYSNGVNPFYYNPNDSTTKECSQLGGSPGQAISVGSSNSPFPIVGTDPTVLSRLPAGHSVQRYMTQPNASTGSFDLMGQFSPGSTPSARIAARWYIYYSPNFVWSAGGSCPNSGKWMAPRPGFLEGSYGSVLGYWTVYGWGGWGNIGSASPEWGPGADPASEHTSRLAGKWWRVEVVLSNNTGGPGARLIVYRKNVTDNGPEYVVVDTAVPCTSPPNGPGCSANTNRSQDWSASTATSLTVPGGLIDRIGPELYRRDASPGGCPGFAALSHYAVAAWSTNAGQRIGAATEIEGGVATSGASPAAPSGVTVR